MSLAALAATTFGLCGLAVGVPLMVVLGDSPTFFMAHGAERSDIIAFAATVTVGPAVSVLAFLALARRLAMRWSDLLTRGVIGLLAAAVLLPFVDRATPLPLSATVPVVVLLTVAFAWLYGRVGTFRRFARLTAVGPAITAIWFLLLSPTSGLVLPQPELAEARARADVDVVLVILDELPLAVLMDEGGNINGARFPGFAELARRSTWYRHATTVAPWTNLVIPSLLSGKMPQFPATARHYQGNIFSMLESTHQLFPHEVVTRMCRSRACGEGFYAGQLYDDAAIVYMHTLLPTSIADRALPSINDRWANFRGRDDFHVAAGNRKVAGQPGRFDRFLDSLRSREAGRPAAWVGHFLLPHFPLAYLPDGRIYDTRPETPGLVAGKDVHTDWIRDQGAIDVGRQRFLLQTRFVDTLVSRLIEALKATERYDETLLIVTSDHGVSFAPGSKRGAPYTLEKAPEVLPIPMFVKYPGQAAGAVDARPVQTIDILPTIADVLDVDVPPTWRFDGSSFAGKDDGRRRVPKYHDGGRKVRLPYVTDPQPAVGPYMRLFGRWNGQHDTYAWGPHRQLIGVRPNRLRIVPSGTAARLTNAQIRSYDPGASVTPAFIELAFESAPSDGWIAVAINDRIAGLGRTYKANGYKAMAMTDPSFLRQGENAVSAFLVSDSGTLTSIELEGEG